MTEEDEELETLRRHAAVGRVVTGVVHESRNILTGALSFAQIGKRRAQDEASTELFGRIEVELSRILELFRHSLDAARGESFGTVALAHVDVAGPLRSVHSLIREQARLANVRVIVDVPNDLPPVAATERYVVQIILNLCINALHVSPAEGEVRISVRQDDEWLDILVSDAGCGVPSESREKIFEPFFTTKGDVGTGLGLSLSRKKAREVGGDLLLVAGPGPGATFMLRLRKV